MSKLTLVNSKVNIYLGLEACLEQLIIATFLFQAKRRTAEADLNSKEVVALTDN